MLSISVLLWTLCIIRKGLASSIYESPYVPYVSPESGEPSCAEAHTYCVKVENYPNETIVKLLKTASREITSYLSINSLHQSKSVLIAEDHFQHYNLATAGKLGTNISIEGMHKKEEQLCRSVIRIIKPLVGRNEKNQWRYIVNVPGSEQVLEIEYCKNVLKKCNTELYCNSSGIYAQCETKMTARRLLALDPSGKKLTWHNSILPTCCRCTLYEDKRFW